MPDVDPVGETVNSVEAAESVGQSRAVYMHDSSMVPELAQLADSACEGARDVHEVSTRLGRAARERDVLAESCAVRELAIAFMHCITPRALGSGKPGADLVPLDGPSYPRALRDADENVRMLWGALASSVTHPAARARFADILVTLRLIKEREAAEMAVRGYLDSVGGSFVLSEQGDGLIRAWGLSRSFSLDSLASQISTAMLGMVEGALSRCEDSYVVTYLLDVLVMAERKKKGQSKDSRLDDLLDRALLTYPDTNSISELAALVRRRAGSDEMRVQHASEVEVRASLNDADKAVDAMIIRTHLNDAASKARRLRLPALEALAVSRLQAAPPVEWKSIVTEHRIPSILFREFLRPYRRVDTWEEGLAVWFDSDCPSGARKRNEAAARDTLNLSPISRLATTIVFGSGDLPKRVLAGDDDVFQHELVRQETMSFRLNGIMLANALDLLKKRFGVPSCGEIEKFLAGAGGHPALSRALAKALQLYWVGEFEAVVYLSVPKVEAAARALLLELNEPMYRASVGDASGVFPGLGTLLEPLLDNGFDPDWERFLRAFLLNDGENIRNLAAHGFLDEVNRETAALALRASALVILIASEESASRDRDFIRAALAAPAGGRSRSWWQRATSAVRAARREMLR
ncbi:hypothetical protein ACGFZK_26320 [Streptomyces sp. NPDC048257]|uniref:hypothetical protein n=1 Tax=Streptomyces sp. NPDC048257 TaxID=3365526 RepID=UPI0037148C73